MAYTLKTTGVATALTFCVAVDEDGTTVKEFVSSAVNAAMTVDGNVTVASSSWKGSTRGSFETKANGTFDFYGVTFGATKPPWNLATAQWAFFIASAGASSSNDALLSSSGGSAQNRIKTDGSGHASFFLSGGDRAHGSTVIPTDGSTKFSFGGNYLDNTNADFFYGLESGSLASDGTNVTTGFGSDVSLAAIGGYSGNGKWPGKWHAVCGFNRKLTLAEFQSLHGDGTDDWFSTLFTVASAPVLDEDGEWVITTQSW